MAGFKREALSLRFRSTHPTAADVEGDRYLIYVYSDGNVYIADETGANTIIGTVSVQSSGGTITVVEDGLTSNVEVTDYISATEVAAISAGLDSRIDSLEAGTVSSIEGLTGAVDVSGGKDITINTDGGTLNIISTGLNETEADALYSALGHTHTSADVTDFDEAAQDAVGGILADTNSLDFTYSDSTPSISASVITDPDSLEVGTSGVRLKDTVTGNRTFSNDLTVTGDLFVNGDQFIVNTEAVSAEDNIIVVNAGEVGNGVTAGSAGIRVDRGSEDDFFFVFDEVRDAFAVGSTTDETSGSIASLQLVATREDNPTDGYIAQWNDSLKRFDTVAPGTIGGVNSIEGLTGAVDVSGGKDITINTDGGTLNIISTGLNETEADALYSQLGHTHTSADVTDFDEAAQDAVGTILVDSASIDLVYSDSTPGISATLTDTGVTANTYGSDSAVGQFTVDSQGRLTSASDVNILHNSLTDVQGGNGSDEYYHLTLAQFNDYIGATEVASVSAGLDSRITTNESDISDLQTATDGITGGTTQLDDRYVNVTGDTMTGLLTISSGGLNVNAGAVNIADNLDVSGTAELGNLSISGSTISNTSFELVIDTPTRINNANLAVDDNLTVGDGTDSAFIFVDGAAGQAREIRFETDGDNRWHVGVTSDTESGSAAGSNFEIRSYDDAGSLLATPLSITRSTGEITLATDVTASSDLSVGGNLSLASGSSVSSILDEDDLSSDSDTALATQQSIKAYVDAQVVAGATQVTANGVDVSTLELSGGFPTSLVADASGAYDLGSVDRPWRDLYLTNNSLYLGSNQITTDGISLFIDGSEIALVTSVTNVETDVATISGDLDALEATVAAIDVAAGTGVSVVESPTDTWTVSVDDYISATEVASVSAGLDSRIDALETGSVSSIEGLTGAVDVSGGKDITINTDGGTLNIISTGLNETEADALYAALGHTHTSADVTDFDEAAQDAVGGILADTASLDFTYSDGTPSISASVITDPDSLEVGASGVRLKDTVTGDRTFSNDVTVSGNLYVNGTEFIVNTESVSAEDNIIVVNAGEVGNGVTSGYAGISVDRGSEDNYFFIFDEVRDAFAIGSASDETSGSLSQTQLVATREDNPTDGYIAQWNDTLKRFDTVAPNTVGSVDSVEGLTGAVDVSGGKDITINTDGGTLNIISTGLNETEADALYAALGHTHTSADVTDFDEAAQDAVGGILVDSASIDLVYSDSTPGISATLTDTGVSANTYGSSSEVGQFTVDSQGRITSASDVSILHNSLSDLQGGTAGEYYHLTQSQFNDFIGSSEVASLTGALVLKSGDTMTGDLTFDTGANIVLDTSVFTPSNSGNFLTWTSTGELSDSNFGVDDLGEVQSGVVTCDTNTSVYTIAHTAIDLDQAFPLVSLIVPASGSALYVQGITNRTTTSFDVVLSGTPEVSGYTITWGIISEGLTGVTSGVSTGTEVASGAATFTPDASQASSFEWSLSQNATINAPTNMTNGTTVTLALVQTAGGGHTITWDADYVWQDDTEPTLSSTGTDIITVIKINGIYYAAASLGF